MADTPSATRPGQQGKPDPLRWPARWVVSFLALVSLGYSGFVFLAMFKTVKLSQVPFFGGLAWVVPAGSDVLLVFLAVAAVLLELTGMGWPLLRPATFLILGFSVSLNVSAANGAPKGELGHALLPIGLMIVLEFWRYFIRRRYGLASGRVRERIPLSRWVFDFADSWQIQKLMIRWKIYSYTEALKMRQVKLCAEADLRSVYGALWRDKVAPSLLVQLGSAEFLNDAAAECARLAAEHRVKNASASGSRGPRRSESASGSRGPRRSESAPGPRSLDALLQDARELDKTHRLLNNGRKISARSLRSQMSINWSVCRDLWRQLPAEASSEGKGAVR